jgi:hypothetical protein
MTQEGERQQASTSRSFSGSIDPSLFQKWEKMYQNISHNNNMTCVEHIAVKRINTYVI